MAKRINPLLAANAAHKAQQEKTREITDQVDTLMNTEAAVIEVNSVSEAAPMEQAIPVTDAASMKDTVPVKEASASKETKSSQKKAPSKKKEGQASQKEIKKYNGSKKQIQLRISSETISYLQYKSINDEKPMNTIFSDLMITAINTYEPNSDELEKQFRSTQRGNVPKNFLIDEELNNDIKKTAKRFMMKYGWFISYVLEREKNNDQDYRNY